jgi:hypothetical protein
LKYSAQEVVFLLDKRGGGGAATRENETARAGDRAGGIGATETMAG